MGLRDLRVCNLVQAIGMGRIAKGAGRGKMDVALCHERHALVIMPAENEFGTRIREQRGFQFGGSAVVKRIIPIAFGRDRIVLQVDLRPRVSVRHHGLESRQFCPYALWDVVLSLVV